MNNKNFGIKPFLFLIAFCLVGCINVNDFGKYWDQGKVDPALEGYWLSEHGECSHYVKQEDHYEIENDGSIVKTLTVGNATFLMVKNMGEQFIYKYSANDNVLELYNPKRSMAQEFSSQYNNPNIVIDQHTVTINTLDQDTVKILKAISQKPDYWETASVFEKQDGTCAE